MVGKLEGYRPFENTGMNGRIIFNSNGLECVESIVLGQDRGIWRAVVNTVMNIWVL